MRIKKTLFLAVGILIATAIGNIAGNYFGENSSTTSPSQKILKDGTNVVVIRQANPGLTAEMLNDETLHELESWNIKMLKTKVRDGIKSRGLNPDNHSINNDIQSAYVEYENKKLALFKMSAKYGKTKNMRLVRIMGLEKNYIVWVSCINESSVYPSIWSGECGDKVKEIFSVSMKKPNK